MKYAAGVGSRSTPKEYLAHLVNIAYRLAMAGFTIRTGGARGADLAVETGARHAGEPKPLIYHPRHPEIMDLLEHDFRYVAEARHHHPNWDAVKGRYSKMLLARNAMVVLGEQLAKPATLVFCYHPLAKKSGGTLHTMRIAEHHHIPVYNIADKVQLEALNEFVEKEAST